MRLGEAHRVAPTDEGFLPRLGRIVYPPVTRAADMQAGLGTEGSLPTVGLGARLLKEANRSRGGLG